jgi:DNA polymerase-3 subunit delta
MIFLVAGPDTYRARERIRALRDKFEREVDASGLNTHTIDGTTLNESDLAHAFDVSPLLARRRFIVIEDLMNNKSKKLQDTVLARLKSEKDERDGNIVVLYEEQPPKGSSPLFAWLMQNAHAQTFSSLSGTALIRWVDQLAESRNRVMLPEATKELISIHGSDLWGLVNDFNKIDAHFAPDTTITEADVRTLCGDPYSDDIFLLVDSIVSGDLKKSAPMLLEHLSRGLSPQQLIGLLEKQFSVLIQLLSGEKSPSGVHPFVVKKLTKLCASTSLDNVKNAYKKLAEVDLELKSSSTPAQTILLQYLSHISQK